MLSFTRQRALSVLWISTEYLCEAFISSLSLDVKLSCSFLCCSVTQRTMENQLPCFLLASLDCIESLEDRRLCENLGVKMENVKSTSTWKTMWHNLTKRKLFLPASGDGGGKVLTLLMLLRWCFLGVCSGKGVLMWIKCASPGKSELTPVQLHHWIHCHPSRKKMWFEL